MSRPARTAAGPRATSKLDLDNMKIGRSPRKLKALAAPADAVRTLARIQQETAMMLAKSDHEREIQFTKIAALQEQLLSEQDLIAGLRSRIAQISGSTTASRLLTSTQTGRRKKPYMINSENVGDFLSHDPFLLRAVVTSQFDGQFDEIMENIDPTVVPQLMNAISGQMNRLSLCVESFKQLCDSVRDEDFMNRVNTCAHNVFKGKWVTVFLRDQKSGENMFRYQTSGKDMLIEMTTKVSIMADALESQQVFIVNENSQSDARSLDLMVNKECYPCLLIPIGKIAVINIRGARQRLDGFTVEDQTVGTFFSYLFAPLFEAYLLNSDLTKAAVQRRTLFAFEAGLESKRNFDELLPFLLSVLSDFCGANDAELFVVGDDSFYTFEVAGEALANKTLPFAGIPKLIFDNKAPLNAVRLNPDEHEAFNEEIDKWTENKSFLGLPVIYEEKVVAVLCISDKLTANVFDTYDLEFLTALTSALSLVLSECMENAGKTAGAVEAPSLRRMPTVFSDVDETQIEQMDAMKDVAILAAKLLPTDVLAIFRVSEDGNTGKRLMTVLKGNIVDKGVANDAFITFLLGKESPYAVRDLSQTFQFQPTHDLPLKSAVSSHDSSILVIGFDSPDADHDGTALSVFVDIFSMMTMTNKLTTDIGNGRNANLMLRNVIDVATTAGKNRENPLEHMVSMVCDLIGMNAVALFVDDSRRECHAFLAGSAKSKPGTVRHDDPLVTAFRGIDKPRLVEKFMTSDYGCSHIVSLFSCGIGKALYLTITHQVFAVFVGDSVTSNYAQVLGYFKPIICAFITNFQLRTAGKETAKEQDYANTTLMESDITSRLFNVTRMNDSEKMEALVKMFTTLDVLDRLKIDTQTLARVLVRIRAGYNAGLGFHNWDHAVDSTQFVFSCLMRGRGRKVFQPIELMAIMLAAACHDIGHEGLTTTYHNKVRSRLIHTVGEQSTMERFSAGMGADIILSSDLRPALDNSVFWKFFVSCIVATDMIRHFEFLEAFKGIVDQFDAKQELHRLTLAEFFVKCGNFGNTTRPFDAARTFGLGLEQEYNSQASKEKEVNVELTKFGDEENMPIWDIEVSFYTGVVDPTFKLLSTFSPELNDVAVQMGDNAKQWGAYGERHKKSRG